MIPGTESTIHDLIGNLCEIKTEQNDLLVIGRIESVDPMDQRRVNIVSTQEDERLPLLAYDTQVKIITFSGKKGFSLMRGAVYISTPSMLALVNVQTAQGYERRKYFRVNTNIQAKAILQQEQPGLEEFEEDSIRCTLYDISLGGIRIGCDRILKPNDFLLVTFTLLDRRMEFCCRVCREIFVKRPLPGQRQYGCEFVNFSTQQIDQLCNVLFKLQRIEIHNKKKNRYD